MVKKIVWFVFSIIVFTMIFVLYKVWGFTHTVLVLPQQTTSFVIPKGSHIKAVASILTERHIPIDRCLFALYARYNGQAQHIKAGVYETREGQTAANILTMIANGEVSKRYVTLIEGWTYHNILATIEGHADIKKTREPLTEKNLLAYLNVDKDIHSLEGLLFPDTYVFAPGDTDIKVIQLAYKEGQKHLQQHWQTRDEGLPFKSPYEALIMASIVEKETGHHEDRAKVAGVFVNRLKKGMPLQSDPTVIYGMGSRYKGRIGKQGLKTDTPWNTYTRSGLPPTPIASPGEQALVATLHPEQHRYLYFVSRGDGTSEFAETLAQHNRNVRKFILKKK